MQVGIVRKSITASGAVTIASNGLSVLDAITETRADAAAMMREMITEAHRIIDAHWDVLTRPSWMPDA